MEENVYEDKKIILRAISELNDDNKISDSFDLEEKKEFD